MIGRVVVVESEAVLSLDKSRLSIEPKGGTEAFVPIEDLAVLLLDHAYTSVTVPLLAKLAGAGVAVVVCDEKHMPASLLQPFESNSLHALTVRAQSKASVPRKKRLWQAIVQAKLIAQSREANRIARRDGGIAKMVPMVRSGDPDNVEGRAASIYFPLVFGAGFLRDQEGDGANALLNYGYAVVRAAVARAVVGAGLHPAFGIGHYGRFNAFALADDLMEPLRPLVDHRVVQVLNENPPIDGLLPEHKRNMVGVLTEEVGFDGKRMPILVALGLYAARFRECLIGEARKLQCPET